MILPFLSFPGEITGLVGSNMTKSQISTGNTEMPSITAAVQESGAIDIILEENKDAASDDHDQATNCCGNDSQRQSGVNRGIVKTNEEGQQAHCHF